MIGRAGGQRRAGPDRRRARHRQGAGGGHDPRQQRAPRSAVRDHRLRHAAAGRRGRRDRPPGRGHGPPRRRARAAARGPGAPDAHAARRHRPRRGARAAAASGCSPRPTRSWPPPWTPERFSLELYELLSVITVRLRPLRERREDIPPLVRHFIQRFNDELSRSISGVDDATMRRAVRVQLAGQRRRARERAEARLHRRARRRDHARRPRRQPVGRTGARPAGRRVGARARHPHGAARTAGGATGDDRVDVALPRHRRRRRNGARGRGARRSPTATR